METFDKPLRSSERRRGVERRVSYSMVASKRRAAASEKRRLIDRRQPAVAG
jgi:hypothetical protein